MLSDGKTISFKHDFDGTVRWVMDELNGSHAAIELIKAQGYVEGPAEVLRLCYVARILGHDR